MDVYIAGIEIFDPFAPLTFTLTLWLSYTNLTRTLSRYTRCTNMNFLRQSFQKLLSDRKTDRQTTYAWSLPITWQRWLSYHWIRHTRKPHAARKSHGAFIIAFMDDRSLHCGNRNFGSFGSCDFDLDPITFMYEFDLGDTPDVQIWTTALRAFDRYQNRWPWMILNGVTALALLRYFTEFSSFLAHCVKVVEYRPILFATNK